MDIYFINNTVKTDVYNAVKIGLNLLGLRKPQNNETDMIPLIFDEVEDFVNLSFSLMKLQKVIKKEEKKNIQYLFGALIPYIYRKTAKCNRFYYEQETDAWTIILNSKTQSITRQIKAEDKNKHSLYLFLDSTGSVSRV